MYTCKVLCDFLTGFLTLYRSDDGLTNGPKINNLKEAQLCCARLYINLLTSNGYFNVLPVLTIKTLTWFSH